jgi:hypothetical protein
VFNIFSEMVLSGISFSSCEIVLLLRGVVQGDPTTQIALELDRDYSNLLKWRHRIQEQGLANRLAIELGDEAVEVDEVYQNSGHKGPTQDDDASSPPRERANNRPGEGSGRVVRGGSFVGDIAAARTTNRQHQAAEYGYPTVGFRCVQDVE